MTPVAPFLAVLVAALAAVLVSSGRQVPRRTLIFLGVAAATVTAVAWDRIGQTAAFLFWELPGRATDAVALATASVAVAVAIALVGVGLARARTRPLLTAVVLGCIVGICVPFLPIVMDLGMEPEDFYRLIWFPSWI